MYLYKGKVSCEFLKSIIFLTHRDRIIAFDGIRGIAVILVMLLHAHFQIGKGGAIGVDMFFVLSGFLITRNFLDEIDFYDNILVIKFWIKRFFRLFPAFFLLLVFVFFVGILTKDSIQSKSILIETRDAFLYLSNVSWLWTKINYERILGHTWSLSVEQQFYFIWPLFIFFFHKYLKSIYFFLSIVFTLFFLSIFKQFYNTSELFKSVYFESIFIGCILAFALWNKWINVIKTSPLPFLGLSFILMSGFFGFEYKSYLSIEKGMFLFVPVATVLLILHALSNQDSIVNKILCFKPLVFIGSISYSLYLWHIPIFRLFKWYSFFPPSVSFILKFAATFLIASLSYFFLEKRMLKISKNIVFNSNAKNFY